MSTPGETVRLLAWERQAWQQLAAALTDIPGATGPMVSAPGADLQRPRRLQAMPDPAPAVRGELELPAWLCAPVCTGMQAQGDLLVIPWPAHIAGAARSEALLRAGRLPRAGVRLARARARTSGHLLQPDGRGVAWAPALVAQALTLGVLFVPSRAAAVLGHHEHADLRIGAGVYVIRRQRIWAPTHSGPGYQLATD